MLAQPADELALVPARARARPHDPLEPLPARALRVLAPLPDPAAAAPVSRDLAVLQRAAPSAARASLQRPQPEPLLELAARLLRSRAVVVNARLAAVLGHQRHDQVRVVRPARRAAVADRDPPALRRRPLAGEPHLGDELLADLTPPLIRELGLVRVQRQRAVPHVRVTRPDHPAVCSSRSATVTRVPNCSRGSSRNRASSPASALLSSRSLAILTASGRPGHQVRVLVLLALALPDQVAQHPDRLRAARHVRDHGAASATRERPGPVNLHACRPLSILTA